jgi:hypothetical protein
MFSLICGSYTYKLNMILYIYINSDRGYKIVLGNISERATGGEGDKENVRE